MLIDGYVERSQQREWLATHERPNKNRVRLVNVATVAEAGDQRRLEPILAQLVAPTTVRQPEHVPRPPSGLTTVTVRAPGAAEALTSGFHGGSRDTALKSAKVPAL
jgi:hypothetical protein